MSEETQYRTIILTEQNPVRIRENEWTTLAESHWSYRGKWSLDFRVLQHPDARTIVSANYRYFAEENGPLNFCIHAGRMTNNRMQTPLLIEQVGDILYRKLEGCADYATVGRIQVASLVSEVLGKLPPTYS